VDEILRRAKLDIVFHTAFPSFDVPAAKSAVTVEYEERLSHMEIE
jgi:hypothetical protein